MMHIYYMKLSSDCSYERSLALLYGEEMNIVIPGGREELYHCLPQERKEAVDRARNENIVRKRIYTGAFLQHVLAEELGVSMEQLQYVYNQWGKPELDRNGMLEASIYEETIQQRIRNLHFNLSHSGDYIVLVVSDCPVGIDVEYKTKGYDTLAKRCFRPEEYEDILNAGEEEAQKKRFLEYWTMKEAYIKCVGEGMRIPLNSFLIQRTGEVLSVVFDAGRLDCCTLWLDTEYCVSVCATMDY